MFYSSPEYCLQCEQIIHSNLAGGNILAKEVLVFTFESREQKLAWTLLIGVFICLVIVSTIPGCGRGKDPVVPPIQEVEYEYRLVLMDHIHGGKIDNEITIPKGEETWYWVRLEYRQVDTTMPWSVVTEGFTLNVTILGAPSGYWMPDLGLTGGQFRVKAAEYRLEFQPPINAHLGTATIKLSVPEVGAELSITVTVIDNQSDNPPPPPPPSCRELHPVREAIDGFWWDCMGDEWGNTGEPVDPPPPPPPSCRELHPVREAIDGFWWDCMGDEWGNTGEPVDPPPEDKYELRAFPPGPLTLELGEGEIFSFKIWDTEAGAFIGDVSGSELSSWTTDSEPGEEYSTSESGTFVTWLDSGPPDYIVQSFITPGVYVVTGIYVYEGMELCIDIEVQVDFMP